MRYMIAYIRVSGGGSGFYLVPVSVTLTVYTSLYSDSVSLGLARLVSCGDNSSRLALPNCPLRELLRAVWLCLWRPTAAPHWGVGTSHCCHLTSNTIHVSDTSPCAACGSVCVSLRCVTCVLCGVRFIHRTRHAQSIDIRWENAVNEWGTGMGTRRAWLVLVHNNRTRTTRLYRKAFTLRLNTLALQTVCCLT